MEKDVQGSNEFEYIRTEMANSINEDTGLCSFCKSTKCGNSSCCNAEDSNGWVCTRKPGHEGPHIACCTSDTLDSHLCNIWIT